MTDSPGAMLETPFRATETLKRFELSSIRQAVVLMAGAPTFVTSNQSTPSELLLLDQGATSEMMMEPGGTACVIVRVKFVLASGVLPTVVSSTLTMTL